MTAISDNINALIRPQTESVRVHRDDGTTHLHTVEHAPLIEQLQDSTTTVTMTPDQTYTSQFGSKPAAKLDALALFQRIDRESAGVAAAIGVRETRSVTDRLSGIAGASPDLDGLTEKAVRARTRSWLTAARVLTGHDRAPYSPDVPCPEIECEKRGSLRIRIDDMAAVCVECGATWDGEHIGQLGTYVRWASEHLRGPRHWLVDGGGFPVECVVCLGERQQMAERRAERDRALRPAAGAA